VQRISTEVVRHVYQRTRGKITIIGVGGVFSADDAYEKITSGANLIELITSMILKVRKWSVKLIVAWLSYLKKTDSHQSKPQ
jgi:dihydroorotate oxidase A (EC 1.3.3.1)